MANPILLNAASVLLLTLASLAYLLLVAGHVPDQHALVINFMLVPLLFGCAGYFLIKGAFAMKLLLLAVLPLAHVIYFGEDSTKPGLENMIAVGEFVFMCAGVAFSFLANRYLLS